MAKENKQQRHLNVQQVFGEVELVERVFSLTLESYEQVLQFAEAHQFKPSVVVEAAIKQGMPTAIAYYKKRKFIPTSNKLILKERWGNQVQKNVTYTITTHTDDLIDKRAFEMKEYRSQILECAIRGGALDKGLKLLRKLV